MATFDMNYWTKVVRDGNINPEDGITPRRTLDRRGWTAHAFFRGGKGRTDRRTPRLHLAALPGPLLSRSLFHIQARLKNGGHSIGVKRIPIQVKETAGS